jgi:hypothetical protein
MYITSFTVVGSVPFPIDMLRRRNCYPSNGDSCIAIANSLNSDTYEPSTQYIVNLEFAHLTKDPRLFCDDDWRSFGWGWRGEVVTRKV